jgi:hypothetical protein
MSIEPATPLEILTAAFLAATGVDPRPLRLVEWHDSCSNHLITATYPTGEKESVSVSLMLRNPLVAVGDLLRPLDLRLDSPRDEIRRRLEALA